MVGAFSHDKSLQNPYLSFYLCDQTKIVPRTLNAKVVRLKPCSLNDVLHILKELDYTLPIIQQPTT
jgi:predicted class III extradiol MEMO1 family dioxygenase